MLENALQLGSSLYVPATHPSLLPVINGHRYPFLRSVILCTEDAVRPDGVESALANLRHALPLIQPGSLYRFIRVRNPHVMGQLLESPGIERIDGFVLPKITPQSLQAYLNLLTDRDSFWLMPTLETPEVFEPGQLLKLRRRLLEATPTHRVLSLRIGGNDLLRCLSVRRNCRRTCYQGVLGPVIAQIAGVFLPFGLPVAGPVFDGLEHTPVLVEEAELDLEHGLLPKASVHPSQVQPIESVYRVEPGDLQAAERLLDEESPAVFGMNGAMCERSVHRPWAERTRKRAEIFGVRRTASEPQAPAEGRASSNPPLDPFTAARRL
jgi:citrate lyase beta subunit